MGTHGETLLHPFAAATAILRGISGWYRDHPTASVRCFAAQDGPELPPARITDALGEARILDQIGHLQIFQIDHIIGLHQPECRLMMKVPPLSLHLLVLLGQQLQRLLAPRVAWLPARHSPLRFLQRLLRSAVGVRIGHRLSACCHQKHGETQIDTGLLSGGRQGTDWNTFTGKTDIPAVRFMGNGHRFDGALEGTAPAHRDPADLREHQIAMVHGHSIAKLLIREGVIPPASLKARVARLLAGLHPAKEGLERTIESGQHVLQDLGVDIVVFWSFRLDGRQLGTLVGTADTLPALLPRIPAFLQGGVIQLAAPAQDEGHCLFLLLGGGEFVFEGFVNRCGLHATLFSVAARQPVTKEAIHPLAEAKGLSGGFSARN